MGDPRSTEPLEARKERSMELLQAIDDFLAEGISSAATLGKRAGGRSDFVDNLRNGRLVGKAIVARVHDEMKKLRILDRSAIVSDIREIDKLGGFLVMKPTGEIDAAPDGFGPARLHLLVKRGILVASGDTLFEGMHSQTYKVADNARNSQAG